jgi:hypothetical protein
VKQKQQQKDEPFGPRPKFALPVGKEGDPLEIVFGHNAEIRKVLVQFGATVGSLVFSPEDARDVANKLRHYADMADGKKGM